MSQKVRDIGIVALGIINGVNAIYQLLFRQDIVLFIVSAIVILIMNDFFGFEQWESWHKSVVRFTFVFGLVTLVNRYFKK